MTEKDTFEIIKESILSIQKRKTSWWRSGAGNPIRLRGN